MAGEARRGGKKNRKHNRNKIKCAAYRAAHGGGRGSKRPIKKGSNPKPPIPQQIINHWERHAGIRIEQSMAQARARAQRRLEVL